MSVKVELVMDFTKNVNAALEMDVASPCIKLCKIDAGNGLCSGCYRTLDEISLWSRASSLQKLQILQALEKRRDQIEGQMF